ncbi:MAG: 3-hydroxybutyrate oligomer hydrolase family protein [Lysobacterales bacterium]
MNKILILILPDPMCSLLACPSTPMPRTESTPKMFTAERTSEHRGSDDLLTAGFGLAGLRAMVPPAFADAEHPTAAELRRRAIWSNWRGIADLTPNGGYGDWYGSVAAVPGREFHALATVPGARFPHRVMAQVPDAFNLGKPCLLVAAASGSRGVYGAIAVASAWGLPKGCAVVHTDKGAGTDWFDLDSGTGVRPDGTSAGRTGALAFAPDAGTTGVAFKHAHSRDNPEADWGRHVRQAAEFGLHALAAAFPQSAPFTFDNTRVIAVGISNGGGAVLRAAELMQFDAVVAGEPNITVAGARPLYDYTTEAALLMPCALLHFENLPQPPLAAQSTPLWALRCASLKAAGVIEGADSAAQARFAYERLRANGWTDAALRAGALSVEFDLWRAVAVTYASAYGRYGAGEHPCSYGFAAQNADFSARAATADERASWWSDASGIAPGAGVGIVDARMAGADPLLPGLQCLRTLWDGRNADADRVRKGVLESRAGLPRAGVPIIVVHGVDDGLVPMAFTSAPYVAQAQAAGRDVRFWQVRNAQHFDAFLAIPDYAARYVPMLPYVYAALDRAWAHLETGAPLPTDAVIDARPRTADQPLALGNLAIPH